MLKNIVFALSIAYAAMAVMTPASTALAGQGDVKKVAIHVNDNDKAKMNLALNNAANIYKYYKKKGEAVEVRIVAYGPGLHMFRDDTSPVKDRIERMALAQDGLTFAACGNTHRKMSKKEGKKPPILTEAKMVPSGVVELMELQMKGWTYIKP
ncbi:MAG: DsrE family protein [Alphaproteobacteria bacterium]|nr:DsrE family protein [Alphaproteobacteria bacterium]